MEEKEELKKLIDALRVYVFLNCEVFEPGCFSCNEVDCQNYSDLCLLVGRVGSFFLKHDNVFGKRIEDVLVEFLRCGNKGIRFFAFCNLEKARITGRALSLMTLLDMQKFRENPANSQAILGTEIVLRAETAPWN